jgi:hypothetical protein
LDLIRACPVQQQLTVPANHRQQVIEIVRNSTRQPSNGFHSMCLAKQHLQFFLHGLGFLHAVAQPVERPGHFSHFIFTALFQWKFEVPLFQRMYACDQIFQRSGKRMGEQED